MRLQRYAASRRSWQGRLRRQRPRERHPLRLPAGELVRVAVEQLGPQLHRAQQSQCALLAPGPSLQAVHGERLCDDRGHRHARVERGARILEDDLHLAPDGAQLALGQRGQVASPEA